MATELFGRHGNSCNG